MMNLIKTSFLFLVSLNFSLADWNLEEKKINYLLNKISKVEGKFVRNDKEHSPQDAVKHMKMKLATAQNSWFAPKKSEWTAKMFIEKIASKSSFSGNPYKIKFNNGRVILVQPWLIKQLQNYK